MLSVILYGRNDSHGYNLHKRAAISLNAIAHLLTDPADEIIFVDYNTPDDLPTFPEAIADTLTPAARERLRILRVRSEVHRTRYAARTHLAALEPIARNVAIRRSNPANKWVLSTNTDMIFCPAARHGSLTAVVVALEDGFYHLPRFELPEGLWESLDRQDPEQLIASAREWGQRFHLNEITLADRANLYDAPGDFQLFLRQDLFEIGAFHEEMILGWHLDANMARRMQFLRGKVSSALDHLVGYHCDHTRQASVYHKADRAENDQVRFDDQVTQARVDDQVDAWGLPDVDIEEFKLGEGSAARYFKGLQASIPAGLEGFLETQYLLEDFGRIQYTPDHVLPYLLDLVSCLPSQTRIGYIGGRPDTFAKFVQGWTAMGGGAVCVPEAADWLGEGASSFDRAPLEDWLERTDTFIFDVSAEQATHHVHLSPQESARLWQVDNAFKRAVDSDAARQATGAPPRRVLVINGVHNFFESQMMAQVAVTLTPFSSRIRHGYIASRAEARAGGAGPAQQATMALLGALEPPSRIEIAGFGDLLAGLSACGPDDQAWAQAASAGAELEAYVETGLIDAGALTGAIIDRVRDARPSSLAGELAGVDAEAGRTATGRLVRLEDWENPEWMRVARRLFSNRDHASLFERDPWSWERVSLAQNLMRAQPSATQPKILVVGKAPELLAFGLAHQGYEVDIADQTALSQDRLASADWRAEFAHHGWVSPKPVGLIEDRAAAIGEGFRYDAVLLPQNGVLCSGRTAAADVLRNASGLLKAGGHLGFAALGQPILADKRVQDHAFPALLTAEGALAKAIQAWTNLDMDGAIDGRLTPRTLDRSIAPARPGLTPPALVKGAAPDIEAVGVWAFTRTDRPADWEALRSVLESGTYEGGGGRPTPASASQSALFTAQELAAAPPAEGAGYPGSCFDALTPMSGLVKSPTSLRVPSSFGAALAAKATLGRIAPGSYELDMELQVSGLTGSGPVFAVAVVTEAGLAAEAVLEVDRTGANRLHVPFDLGEDGRKGVAVLIKALGHADVDILAFSLR